MRSARILPELWKDSRTRKRANITDTAQHFVTTRGRPSQDALTSGRLDWNPTNSDRIFFYAYKGEQGWGAFYSDPISAAFNSDYAVSLWQGQFVETHTFEKRRGAHLSNELKTPPNQSFRPHVRWVQK
jgi:hypothetical protein